MSTQVTKDSFKKILTHLGNSVLKLVADPCFKPRTSVFLRRIVNEMGVDKEGIPTGGIKFEDHIFEKPLGISVSKYPELIPQFQDTVNEIVPLYGWQKPKAEFWARQFVSWISEKAVTARFDKSVVEEGVQLFMADLEKTPVIATVKAFLLGITPRRHSISIGENLTIRKVRKEDLTLEYNVAFPPPKQPVPHSIAEICMDVYDRMDLLEHQRAPDKLVSILKLFKPWSVSRTKCSIIFPTIMPFGSIYDISYPRLGIKGNIIEASDEKVLKKLYSVLLPMMPKDSALGDGTDAVSIAYRLYSNALINRDRPDWKLATAVAGLDALYVQGGVDQTFKLTHRAAKLLGLLGENPELVGKIVKESFDIRSRVFHGNRLKAKQAEVVPKYFSLMCEYLRKSILLFLFVTRKQGISKKSIIKCIDYSFVGRTGEEELKKLLEATKHKIGCDYVELGFVDNCES